MLPISIKYPCYALTLFYLFVFVEEGVREEAAQVPGGGRRRWGGGWGCKIKRHVLYSG